MPNKPYLLWSNTSMRIFIKQHISNLWVLLIRPHEDQLEHLDIVLAVFDVLDLVVPLGVELVCILSVPLMFEFEGQQLLLIVKPSLAVDSVALLLGRCLFFPFLWLTLILFPVGNLHHWKSLFIPNGLAVFLCCLSQLFLILFLSLHLQLHNSFFLALWFLVFNFFKCHFLLTLFGWVGESCWDHFFVGFFGVV